MTAAQIFKSIYGGSKNFMTPNVDRYEEIHNGAVELSSERGFLSDRMMYGVTVAKEGRRRDDLSRCFRNKRVREAYIHGLKKGLWK